MTAVLVSGGGGLVGRYIVEHLLAHGYRVKIASRQPPPRGLFSAEVEHVPLSLDPDADNSCAFDDVYHFIHAAFDHVPGRYRGGEGDDPEGFRRNNLEGSIQLFETARRAGVRRVIFLSSRAVYDGVEPGTPLSEDLQLSPATLYGEVKLKAEGALAFMSEAEPGFSGTSLRVTGVYGNLRPNKWDKMFADYLDGRPVEMRAGSEVHGSDVAAACRMMLEAETAKVAGESFNISDVVTDTHRILAHLKAATGSDRTLPDPADRKAVAVMPTEKIRALGWEPGGEALLAETVAELARSIRDRHL
ncbi:NAD(P)-dependent oxidoreductase [Pseudohoeflea suaedae]|uniref:UDP-glucose 4-epimerase n=1 Tax=Pseudohoeflea suaedae TaxID=877384 RepID=A0A4R5PIW6_9HYPH|nr:NAD(P)-dependent oxidoreductase [Pseudohoeflea suaedae]TDH35112.1 NAD(P)-dependent oxidoreductase [Pseudohoeflea suaedae]